jgi:hypothetical protein
MVTSSFVFDDRDLVVALAWSHSLTYLLGAASLLLVVRSRLARRQVPIRLAGVLARQVAAVAAAAGAMAGVAAAVDLHGRVGEAVTMVVAAGVGLAVHVAAQSLLGGPRPTTIVELLRGAPAPGAQP